MMCPEIIADKPIEIDHHLHEFGSVEYHVQAFKKEFETYCKWPLIVEQSSLSDPQHAYLSISTPLLSQGDLLSYGLSHYSMEMVKAISLDVVEIVQPAKEGYQLTLRLNLSKIPRGKDSMKVISEISTVQATILSSQLKEMLWTVNSEDTFQGMCKPIKLVYHPRETFYVIKQELTDVGSSKKWAKVPPCCWAPIPPPELRGEPFEDLSTNGGFVTFGVKIFLVITLTISNGLLTFLTDKIVQKVHERFHTEKDEKAIGKFG
ncbi:actin-related protein 2/3 complex subunit 2B [Citrus sinensis]|uniref:Actin-related protein 2/3 complex subunit 2B n=1 Tax=Citrus sinensis TaxID=2711 RepID=A0ACB8I427_CITSI|nr:actin-related protein 2/3 complex subunit 2B [Citrus sinensis]